MADIPVQEISEMFDMLSAKMPKLISGLMDSLYSAEAGQKIGQAVGSFYKQLVESGIPSEEALQMAKDYMLAIKEVTSSLSKNMN
jgi:hypothetical protein